MAVKYTKFIIAFFFLAAIFPAAANAQKSLSLVRMGIVGANPMSEGQRNYLKAIWQESEEASGLLTLRFRVV